MGVRLESVFDPLCFLICGIRSCQGKVQKREGKELDPEFVEMSC